MPITIRPIHKVALGALCLVPFVRLLVLGGLDRLGANPVEFVTRSTGTWTLVLVCATLAVTPLRRLTGINSLVRVRRMLGLFAFSYGCLHLVTYLWFDQWFEWQAIAQDIAKRPLIFAGFAGWLAMLPLALTSTDAMMRRLGRRWGVLHRAAYAVAVLGVLHLWWHKAGKNDLVEPLVYAAVVVVLLGWRVHGRMAPASGYRGNRRSSA